MIDIDGVVVGGEELGHWHWLVVVVVVVGGCGFGFLLGGILLEGFFVRWLIIFRRQHLQRGDCLLDGSISRGRWRVVSGAFIVRRWHCVLHWLLNLIVDDGEDPSGDPLPLEKRPERANTSCTEINEFPDKLDPAEGRRAMQIILDLGAWDKPSFEASLGAQGLLFKSLADSIASRNIYNTAMRMFNVDNSAHGAGPKIRIWSQSQQDCIDYATYIKGLRDTPSLGSYPNGALMDSYVSTSDFVLVLHL